MGEILLFDPEHREQNQEFGEPLDIAASMVQLAAAERLRESGANPYHHGAASFDQHIAPVMATWHDEGLAGVEHTLDELRAMAADPSKIKDYHAASTLLHLRKMDWTTGDNQLQPHARSAMWLLTDATPDHAYDFAQQHGIAGYLQDMPLLVNYITLYQAPAAVDRGEQLIDVLRLARTEIALWLTEYAAA